MVAPTMLDGPINVVLFTDAAARNLAEAAAVRDAAWGELAGWAARPLERAWRALIYQRGRS